MHPLGRADCGAASFEPYSHNYGGISNPTTKPITAECIRNLQAASFTMLRAIIITSQLLCPSHLYQKTQKFFPSQNKWHYFQMTHILKQT
jgi:hypothetical protein